jgi:hypothetical protein
MGEIESSEISKNDEEIYYEEKKRFSFLVLENIEGFWFEKNIDNQSFIIFMNKPHDT